jgi:hypothetical protein
MQFSQSAFAQFLASSAGRVTRMIVGFALILGAIFVGGTAGTAMIIVGLVPLLAGFFDVCLVTALFGGPFLGAKVRALG